MSDICEEGVKKNLGKSNCTALPKVFKRMIWTPNNFRLASGDYATAAALKTALQALLLLPINSRGYLFPQFSSIEDNSEEAQYEETVLSRIPIRDGQYRYKPMISHNLCTHKAMFSHRSLNNGRVIFQDLDNQLFLTDPLNDGNLAGFSLSLLWTEKLRISNGSNSTLSPIVVDLSDNEEIDARGVLLADGQVANELEPLTDVTISLASGDAFAADEFYVDVKQTCDGVPISGLLLADFVMKTAALAAQVIDSAAEDPTTPGRYLIVADTAFVDGTLTLRAPSLLTVKAYEVPSALAVNVP